MHIQIIIHSAGRAATQCVHLVLHQTEEKYVLFDLFDDVFSPDRQILVFLTADLQNWCKKQQ